MYRSRSTCGKRLNVWLSSLQRKHVDINSYCSSLEANSVIIKSEVEECLTHHIYTSDLVYFLSFQFSQFHKSQTFDCRHKFWPILELIQANTFKTMSVSMNKCTSHGNCEKNFCASKISSLLIISWTENSGYSLVYFPLNASNTF